MQGTPFVTWKPHRCRQPSLCRSPRFIATTQRAAAASGSQRSSRSQPPATPGHPGRAATPCPRRPLGGGLGGGSSRSLYIKGSEGRGESGDPTRRPHTPTRGTPQHPQPRPYRAAPASAGKGGEVRGAIPWSRGRAPPPEPPPPPPPPPPQAWSPPRCVRRAPLPGFSPA